MSDPSHAFETFLHYLWLFGLPVAFIVVFIYVFWPGRKRKYRQDAQLPFEDDERDRESGRKQD